MVGRESCLSPVVRQPKHDHGMKTMNMRMTRVSCLAFTIVVGFQCISAFAERKPNAPQDAKLVVWGTVEEVVREETDEFNRFKVKIRVENMERGYIRVGNTARSSGDVWAHCFQRKPSAPKVPSASGHTAIPKKGQFIRALLLEPRRGEYEGIYPDWFHELKLNDDQLAAMKWVRTIGSSKLGCDDSLPGRPVTKIHLFKMWDSGVTDADMKYVTAFPELRSLELFYSRVRSDGLKTVATLKKLEELNLGHFRGGVRDQDIRPLAGITSLRKLSLRNARVTDDSMSLFAAMPSLRSLGLAGTKITDAGLEQLKRHEGLESLYVSSSKITDRGVQHLATMKSLKRLSLESTAITGEALKALTKLSLISLDLRDCNVIEAGLIHVAAHKELQTLDLQNTDATDAVLEKLSELKDLRKITLQSTQVTDKGFLYLTKCPKLSEVWIAGTKITPDGVKKFKQALPKCYVGQLSIE